MMNYNLLICISSKEWVAIDVDSTGKCDRISFDGNESLTVESNEMLLHFCTQICNYYNIDSFKDIDLNIKIVLISEYSNLIADMFSKMKDVSIGDGTIIGAESFYHYFDNGLQEFEGLGTVIINDNVSIGSNTIIQRGTFSDTLIGARSRIGNLIDIGHDVFIGHDCKIVSQTGIASNVRIKNYVTIYGQVGVANGINIGNQAVVYAKSLVTKNIDDNQHVSGMYARDHIDELRIQAKLRKL